MERVASRSFEDFPATTIYLDDLQEIVEIIGNTCGRIEIVAGDYRISDPKEIPLLADKFGDRFDSMSIQGREPYISIDLRSYGVRAYISEDSAVQMGIVARIREVLNRGKRRSFGWLYNVLTTGLAFSGAVAIMAKEYGVGFVMLAGSFVLIPLSVKSEMKNKVVVHTRARGQVMTFFQRRKEDILIAAISAGLGGAITHLISKLLS